ncbi:MAG TPA: sialate O-acetylesterase [Bacteroidales bacterium]|nr:sialate O-acetylesterase [Bacteroidales bacterium]
MKRIFYAAFAFLLCFTLTVQGQSPSFETFINPVIPGDHPDATLTKVGRDFYTTGSSFNVTPVIYHSTDLVHWEAIAQPVKASWNNFGSNAGGGCWGGHVVYYNGVFWDFFGRAGSMYFVKAAHPEGPWSSPVKVNDPAALPFGLGQDNSIFIDDNNKWYLLVKNGQANNAIVELNENGQASGTVYNLNWLNPSPYPYSWAEGPVMWKEHGYYYYCFARDLAGGEKVMRSTVLSADKNEWTMLGDFFNTTDPLKSSSLFTEPNHNSPAVMLDDSTSWVIHPLYARDEWKGQGRQGLLNQVKYNSSYRPVADYPVNKVFSAPDLPSGGIPWMVPKSDDFCRTTLNPEWSFIGYTPDATWSLTDQKGWLRLSPKSSSLPNTIVKNDGEHNYSIITRLRFTAASPEDEAGLRIIRGDETKFVRLYSGYNSSGEKIIGFRYDNTVYSALNTIGDELWLKLVRINHLVYGYYSSDGTDWKQVGSGINISVIDSYADLSTFTGTRQGVYVQHSPALFDLYIYRDAYTPIMASCVANQSGTSPLNTGILDNIHNSDWAMYAGVEFGNPDYGRKADTLIITAASVNGGRAEIWLDSIASGILAGTCEITSTGNTGTFRNFKTPVLSVTGRHDVYVKFTGENANPLFLLKEIRFVPITAPHVLSATTLNDSVIYLRADKHILIDSIGGFTVQLNSSVDSVTDISIHPADSAVLLIQIKNRVVFGDKVRISYDGNFIQSNDGLKLASFSDFTVMNTIADTHSVQPDTTFHIYLMFGQSNMEGAGTIEPRDRLINPRVWMMQDSTCPNLDRVYGQWYPAAPPLNRCWGKLGPGDSFGRMLGEQAPAYVSKIGLINVSVSGCNIFIYKKGCPDGLDQISQGIPFSCGYTWLLDLAKKAQKAGVIKGIIFHQGETNNTDQTWKSTVKQIVSDLKSDLGLGDIPFLAGELLYAEYGSCCSAHNVEINKLPAIIPNAHVISAAGLPGADYAHFTSASYRTFGERYARKMLKLVYNVCDSSVIEPWYKINGGTETKGDKLIISKGQNLVLSPHPSNELGTWSWTGAGTSGTSRTQTVTFTGNGEYKAYVTYTNECGTLSRLQYSIVVCDSTPVESWYQVNNGDWIRSSKLSALRGSTLLLGPRAADTTGTWSWSGGGTRGTSRLQRINTSIAGVYTARPVYTNVCGAKSRMAITFSICDSARIESWYRIDNGVELKSDSVTVEQNAVLVLTPRPVSGGTWDWSGAGLAGSDREQTVNTEAAGNYLAKAVYTNACGIQSHMSVKIVVTESTGTNNPENTSVLIYPNPADQQLTIEDKGQSGILKEEILNNLGELVITQDPALSSHFTIDISRLSPGVYYLRLVVAKGIIVRKFIKSN